MAQKIVVRIADKDYSYMVNSPEEEQRMRNAGEMINRKLQALTKSYPGYPAEDKLANVAFGIAVNFQEALNRMASLKEEVERLTAQTQGYLDEIDGK